MNHDKFSDSAGVPWDGRSFEENRFSNDDGSTPPEIQSALDEHSIQSNLKRVVDSLRGKRLLIPLLATLGDAELGPHGQLVEKSADLAIVAVATPDGKTAIPAFTSVAEMAAWNKEARPVPVEAERVAISAISEGHERVILNAASAAIGIRRPALAAVAQQVPWAPPEAVNEVYDLVAQATSKATHIDSFELKSGDPHGSLSAAELKIVLSVRPGLSAEELNRELTLVASQLRSEEFLNLVDSVSFQVLAS
ncbi:MAG: hypothetical protein RIS51_8 [Actinomycetota bacterium]